MTSRRPCVSPDNMSFQWYHGCWFAFPRGCPAINRALYLFLYFFYCILLRAFLLLTFSPSFAFLRKTSNDLVCLLPVILYRESNRSSSPELYLVRTSFAIVIPLVAFAGFSNLVPGFVLNKPLAIVCLMLVLCCLFGGVFEGFFWLLWVCVFSDCLVWTVCIVFACRFCFGFVVRNGSKKDCFVCPGQRG